MTGHNSRSRTHGTSYHPLRVLAVVVLRLVRSLLAFVLLTTLVAGLPWALVHFVGWPLPNHVPAWDEFQAVLLAPMTPEFLIDILACVLWLLWARFTFDVAAAIPGLVRGSWPHHAPRGPLHAVAGVLVSAVVLSILTSRTTTSTTPAKNAAAELATHDRTPAAVAFYSPRSQTIATAQPAGPTEVVRYAEHGVHDSLWRIAERCLGDGARWTEIWELNKNTVQMDGQTFTTPSLIYPGWELRLPASTSEPEAQIAAPPAPQDAPNTESPGHDPDEQSPHTKAPTPGQVVPSEPALPTSDTPPGISTSTGAFVGLGLAALITVALMTVRLHRRRVYRPGTSSSDDPGQTPIVRALRIAHDATAGLDDLPSTPEPPEPARLPDLETRDRARKTALAAQPAQDETMLGVRDGQAVAFNVARGRGLGLIGLGAHAAARALIVTTFAQAASGHAQVIIPAADAHAVFDTDLPRSSPHLRVVDDLTTALDLLEAELVTRTRHAEDPETAKHAPLVLVAKPTAEVERRTQAVLDNGSAFNIAGILFGQWRAGGTLRVRDDGTVGATSPNLADQLSNARLFTLPSTDAADLLALLKATGQAPTADEAEAPQTNAVDKPAKPTALGDDYDFVVAELPNNREPLSATAVASSILEDHPVPLRLQLLGRPRLIHTEPETADIIDAIAPRQREILVYLALHRTGCRRESLTTALWPDAPGDRPYNSFHATLSQLRRALRNATNNAIPNLVFNDDSHYQLNHSLVTVDLWQLQDALTAHRHTTTAPERLAAIQPITDLYRGELAMGITADWIDPAREALRRQVLDACSATVRTVDDDPEQMLTLLETARGMDPYNEAIYRDLMRVQARLGQHDSIPRTLGLLTTSLAELDQRPTRDTQTLASLLQSTPAHRQRTREAS